MQARGQRECRERSISQYGVFWVAAAAHNPVPVGRRIVAAHRDRAAVVVRRGVRYTWDHWMVAVAHRVVAAVVHSRAAVVAHKVVAAVAGSDRCTLGKYLPVPGIIFTVSVPRYHKLNMGRLQELITVEYLLS